MAPQYAGSSLAGLEHAQPPRCTRDLVSDSLNCDTDSYCSISSTAFALASSKAVKYKQLASGLENKKSP